MPGATIMSSRAQSVRENNDCQSILAKISSMFFSGFGDTRAKREAEIDGRDYFFLWRGMNSNVGFSW